MISVPGKIQGKARPKFNRATGHAYTADTTVIYEAKIAEAYKAGMIKKDRDEALEVYHEGPVRVSIIAAFKIPEGYSKAKKRSCIVGETRPTKKPDADNIAKAVLDGLNGVAYKDDTQVVELAVSKVWSSYREELSIFVKDVHEGDEE